MTNVNNRLSVWRSDSTTLFLEKNKRVEKERDIPPTTQTGEVEKNQSFIWSSLLLATMVAVADTDGNRSPRLPGKRIELRGVGESKDTNWEQADQSWHPGVWPLSLHRQKQRPNLCSHHNLSFASLLCLTVEDDAEHCECVT